MRTIAFILPQNPYLPELKAYLLYFSKKGFKTVTIQNKAELKNFQYDIEWHFMGIDTIKPKKGVVKVHDYASLSTPPFARIKDRIKKFFCQKPQIRIFLNEAVKEYMDFKDEVPFCFRDVGVNKIFLESRNLQVAKEYDFCYLGTMHKSRQLQDFLFYFKTRLYSSTILMIGTPTEFLLKHFSDCPNIKFTGAVDYLTVPSLLRKCTYGINYIPDKYPFNKITSVKLTEYCACNLKIVSTKYDWVNNFEKKEKGTFFYLEKNLENFHLKNLENFSFKTPEMQEYDWEIIIEKSGVLGLINSFI